MASKSDCTKSRKPKRAVANGQSEPALRLHLDHVRTLPGFKIPFGSSVRLRVAHHGQFDRVGAAREFRRLQPPMPVFGADAAAETVDQIEYGALELPRRAAKNAVAVGAGTQADIEM